MSKSNAQRAGVPGRGEPGQDGKPLRLPDKRRQGFFMVDNALLLEYGAEIGPYGIAVYCALALHAGAEDAAGLRRCWPSYKTLGEISGISRNAVIGALEKLQQAGLVEVHSGRHDQPGNANQSNLYVLRPVRSPEPGRATRPRAGGRRTVAGQGRAGEGNGSPSPGYGLEPDRDYPGPGQGLAPDRGADYPGPSGGNEHDSLNQTQLNQTQEREEAASRAGAGSGPEGEGDNVARETGAWLALALERLKTAEPPPGLTGAWLAGRVSRYGRKAVLAALTIAEERAKPAPAFISSVLERMTAPELAGFDQDGRRAGPPALAGEQGAEAGAGAGPGVYPFGVFTPGLDDNPAALLRRMENLRKRDLLSPEQEQQFLARVEWARGRR